MAIEYSHLDETRFSFVVDNYPAFFNQKENSLTKRQSWVKVKQEIKNKGDID